MIDGATVVAWADRDDARRRGRRPAARWPVAVVVGVAVAAWAAARGGWFDGARVAPSATWSVLVALAGFVPTMLLAPHELFWRGDAAMVARLPIPGAALWRAALVRATRSAAVALVVLAPTVALTAIADVERGARLAALALALAAACAVLVPAVCVAAAHVVASGQAVAAAASLGGGAAVPTSSLLGALPGAAIAAIVLATVAIHPWLGDGVGPRGPAILVGMVAVAAGAGAWATARAGQILPRAMREVAALDRQILAHLEIHPITAIERAVRARLAVDSGQVFDRLARLVRRRYPLFALGGAAGAVALVAIAWGQPASADPWLAVVAGAQAWLAARLAVATGRPPLELPRATALLPIAPGAVGAARRALVATWVAVWMVAPVAAAIALGPAPLTTAAHLAVGLAGGALLGALRRG